jgi:hypothetical protein
MARLDTPNATAQQPATVAQHLEKGLLQTPPCNSAATVDPATGATAVQRRCNKAQQHRNSARIGLRNSATSPYRGGETVAPPRAHPRISSRTPSRLRLRAFRLNSIADQHHGDGSTSSLHPSLELSSGCSALARPCDQQSAPLLAPGAISIVSTHLFAIDGLISQHWEWHGKIEGETFADAIAAIQGIGPAFSRSRGVGGTFFARPIIDVPIPYTPAITPVCEVQCIAFEAAR